MTLFLNGSYAWMVGVLAACRWLGRSGRMEHRALAQALSTAMTAGIFVCFVATSLSLLQAAAAMADVQLSEVSPALLISFAATHYGVSAIASLVVIALLGILHVLTSNAMRGSAYSIPAAALLLLFAVARVRLGHAYEAGPVSLAVMVELTHLLSMALWSGSVFVAAWVVMPAFREGPLDNTGMSYLHRLSQWAAIALAGVLVSGGYNAYRVLNSPVELLATQYGWILTAKLGFVAFAIVLGGWNRFIGFPAVTADAVSGNGHAWLRMPLAVLRIESVALIIVLTVAAVLTGSGPPSAA